MTSSNKIRLSLYLFSVSFNLICILYFFCRFQKLLKEEYALSNELKSLESKYNDWNRAVSPSVLKPPVRRVSKLYTSNTDSNEEVS